MYERKARKIFTSVKTLLHSLWSVEMKKKSWWAGFQSPVVECLIDCISICHAMFFYWSILRKYESPELTLQSHLRLLSDLKNMLHFKVANN